jgi:hypothetical protein
MKVIDFGADAKTMYRYRVAVSRGNQATDYFSTDSRLDEIQAWAEQQRIRCAILPGLVFFHHEVDVALFLLRWS